MWNVIVTDPVSESTTSSESDVFLLLGKDNIDLTLSSTEQQRVCFKIADELAEPSDPELTELPPAIMTSLKITPQIGSFALDRMIRFTNTALYLLKQMDCLGRQYLLSTDTLIKVPDYFYSCVLDVVSFDIGQTWTVSNIQILPPSLKQ